MQLESIYIDTSISYELPRGCALKLKIENETQEPHALISKAVFLKHTINHPPSQFILKLRSGESIQVYSIGFDSFVFMPRKSIYIGTYIYEKHLKQIEGDKPMLEKDLLLNNPFEFYKNLLAQSDLLYVNEGDTTIISKPADIPVFNQPITLD
jgi:hypothetical protein